MSISLNRTRTFPSIGYWMIFALLAVEIFDSIAAVGLDPFAGHGGMKSLSSGTRDPVFSEIPCSKTKF
jgi:hypothetical protein